MFLLLSPPLPYGVAEVASRPPPSLEHHGQQKKPSRYRGHHGGAQTERRLAHKGWLLSPQLSARPEEKASQHTEKQGVIFLQGLCRRQAQPGAPLVPAPLPRAVRWLRGAFPSLGALVLVLQEVGGIKKSFFLPMQHGAHHSQTWIPSLGFFLCCGCWRKEMWEGWRSEW